MDTWEQIDLNLLNLCYFPVVAVVKLSSTIISTAVLSLEFNDKGRLTKKY